MGRSGGTGAENGGLRNARTRLPPNSIPRGDRAALQENLGGRGGAGVCRLALHERLSAEVGTVEAEAGPGGRQSAADGGHGAGGPSVGAADRIEAGRRAGRFDRLFAASL